MSAKAPTMTLRVWRRSKWWIAILAVAGLSTAIYFLKPVTGPSRDLALIGDATHLIRLGGLQCLPH